MRASIGDKLRVHSNQVGTPDHCGQITEIRGADGGPPYLVRFDDGHERLVFPGGDAVVEPPAAHAAAATTATEATAAQPTATNTPADTP
jgi:hypothetical protein